MKKNIIIITGIILLLNINVVYAQENAYNKESIIYKISNIENDNPNKLKKALGEKNNINLTLSKGYSLLMWAVNNQFLKISQYLVENKVDINAQDRKGNSALLYATNKKNNDIFKLLIKNGADIHLKNNGGQSPLVNIIAKSNIEKLKIIISLKNKKELDLDNAYFEEYSLLNLAFSLNDIDDNIIKLLLLGGADPNSKNNFGEPVIFQAIKKDKKQIVSYFLQKGLNPNIKDQNGNTPLLVAAENGNNEIFRGLALNGGNPKHINNYGSNALMIAAKNGNTHIVSFLMKNYYSQIQERDREYYIAHSLAKTNGHFSIIKIMEQAQKTNKPFIFKSFQ